METTCLPPSTVSYMGNPTTKEYLSIAIVSESPIDWKMFSHTHIAPLVRFKKSMLATFFPPSLVLTKPHYFLVMYFDKVGIDPIKLYQTICYFAGLTGTKYSLEEIIVPIPFEVAANEVIEDWQRQCYYIGLKITANPEKILVITNNLPASLTQGVLFDPHTPYEVMIFYSYSYFFPGSSGIYNPLLTNIAPPEIEPPSELVEYIYSHLA